MQKPSTLLYREFVAKMQDILNNSGLPAFVMLQTMREVITKLEALEEQQYRRDFEEWAKVVKQDGRPDD